LEVVCARFGPSKCRSPSRNRRRRPPIRFSRRELDRFQRREQAEESVLARRFTCGAGNLRLGWRMLVGGWWDGLYAGLQYRPLETSAGRRKTHKVDRARQVQGGTWPLVAAASAGWQDAALHELLDPCRPGAHRGSIARNRETENGPGGSGLRTL